MFFGGGGGGMLNVIESENLKGFLFFKKLFKPDR